MPEPTINWCIGGAALVNFVIAIKVGLDDGIIQPLVGWIAIVVLKLVGAL